MMQLNAHLSFNGQCEEAFQFYERCLGGKIQMTMTYGESPMAGQTAPEWCDKIIHVTLAVDGGFLMGCDAPPPHYEKPQGFSVHIGIDSPAAAERLFQVLSENGTVRMPLQDVLGRPFRYAGRSIRHALDDQLRSIRGGKVADEQR
jgi:PhnB protein